MRHRGATALIIVAVVMAVLSGCSSTPDNSPRSTDSPTVSAARSPATSAPSASSAPGSLPVEDQSASAAPPTVGTGPAGLDDFPQPPGAVITKSGGEDASGFAYAGTVTDPKAAYDFWVSQLPKSGWTLGAHDYAIEAGQANGSIEFSGNGYGSGTIGIFGSQVAVAVQK